MCTENFSLAIDPYDFAEDCIWGGLQAVVYEPGSAMSLKAKNTPCLKNENGISRSFSLLYKTNPRAIITIVRGVFSFYGNIIDCNSDCNAA